MRIGTRRSALALAQANQVADLLGGGEVVAIVTSGDRGLAAADKSRWVLELEQALLSGRIDVAVHSAKDVPGELARGLALVGAPAREAAEDVLCGAEGLAELPAEATVGTSSLRRAAQLRAARDDLKILAMRGNVDTRLGRIARAAAPDARPNSPAVAPPAVAPPAVADGQRATARGEHVLDAIVLARAGLRRLGRESEIGAVLEVERFVPAPGQGVLALEARADDASAREAIEAIGDRQTLACLLAERALARELSATCRTPLGAHAAPADGDRLRLRAWVGLPDGSAWVADELLGDVDAPEELGREVADRLSLAGSGEILRAAQEMAGIGGA
jgi:hydroxymethylbilane synthase